MSDPLAVALARLAPTVDVAASRELLDRSLDGPAGAVPPSANRRRLLAAACVLLLVAGAIGVWAVSGRDDADAPAAPTTVTPGSGDGTEFRVVATEPVGNFDARSIRAAGTDDELVSIVSRFDPDFAPFAADVDLTREVALVIERPDNSCPSEIERFEPVDDTWTVVWKQPGGDCDDIGFGWVYLVAVDRSALTGIEWFVLPAEQQGSLSWEELRVAKPDDPALGPTFTSSSDGGIDGTFPAQAISTITEQAEWDAHVASDMPLVEDGEIDLAEFVVVVIERPDAEGCPGSFDGFDVDEDVWTPRFAAVDAECPVTPMTTRYDVAVRRAALPDEVTFHLPADAVFDLPATEVTMRVRPVPPTTTAPPTPANAEQAALDAATTLVLEAQAFSEPGTAAGAATALQYEAMWSRFLDPPEPPAIDFTTDVAIAFLMLDDGCVAEFRGLMVSRTDAGSTRLVPRFQEPAASACDDVGLMRLFVVSVDRDVLPDTFEFLVPRAYAPSTPNGVATTIDLTAPATSVSTAMIDPALGVPPMSFAPSTASLGALESRLGLVNMFSQIDLEQFAVITFTVVPGQCADTFDRFDTADDGTWIPVFRESRVCDDALPRLVAVSVDREALVGGVTFRYRDAVLSVDPDYAIVDATWDCAPEDSRQFTITLDLPPNGDVTIDVVAGDVIGGSARVQVGNDGLVSSTGFGVTGIEPTEAEAVVTDTASGRVVARMSLAHLPLPTCP